MDTLQPVHAPADSAEGSHGRRRRWTWAAGAAVLALAVAGIVAVVAVDDDAPTVTSPETTVRPSTTGPAEPPETTAPTTAPTDTTTTLAPTTIPSTPTTPVPTTAPPAVVPGVVAVSARPGGGSGEIAVRWDATPGATGYRVLRADAAAGPFGVIADIDVTSGARTAAAEVTTIWSQAHRYGEGTLAAPDPSPWFELIEVGGARQRCFQVVAYAPAGQGQASATACSTSP